MHDIPTLAIHRRLMFAEMAFLRGEAQDKAVFEKIQNDYAALLTTELDRSIFAWGIEQEGEFVSSGAVGFIPWNPHPLFPQSVLAYYHSAYTQPDMRGRGFAKQLVTQAMTYCRERGHKIFRLHASEAGRPIYESLGFAPTNEMQIKL